MGINFRNYTNQMRFTKDFNKVRDFLIHINKEQMTTPNFLWGRWEWMFSLPYLDQKSISKIGIWEDGGQIVGLATYESSLGHGYFCIHSNYSHLKFEMLNYAKNNLDQEGAFKALIPDSDSQFQQIAMAQGFRPTQNKECVAVIDIDDSLSYSLPPGFSITSLGDTFDMKKYNQVLWRGFNHEGVPPETESQLTDREISCSGPHLKRELNIAVVAPNGDFVSYCGIWFDPETDYALVEPVATDPDYRKRGLGKAAVLEAVRRSGKMGARKAYVGSSQQFYYNIGFRPCSTETWWELKVL